jgi:hypothetical protein
MTIYVEPSRRTAHGLSAKPAIPENLASLTLHNACVAVGNQTLCGLQRSEHACEATVALQPGVAESSSALCMM